MGACSAGSYSHYARRLYEKALFLSIPLTRLAAQLYQRRLESYAGVTGLYDACGLCQASRKQTANLPAIAAGAYLPYGARRIAIADVTQVIESMKMSVSNGQSVRT